MIALLAMAVAQDVELPGGNVLACETYSLNRLFRSGEMTLERFPAAMRELGIRGISLNDLYFERWDDEYVDRVKAAIEREGRVVVAFVIDHNGNFAPADDAERAANIEAVRTRLRTAHRLGAPVVRINVGSAGSEAEDDGPGVERVTAAFRSLLPTARELGLKLVIENHGGVSRRAENIVRIIEATDRAVVGACLDFKNWPREAIYDECTRLAPYAYHTHAKSHRFGDDGEETGADYGRILAMLREAGYRGALSIEFEGPGDPIEGVRRTRDLIVRRWR